MTTAQTAAQAFDLYKAAFDSDALTQGAWHTEQDGRFLACALGTLGPNVNSPKDCPATIMPRWLAQMVPWFFDTQSVEDAKAWGLAFYAQLKRLNGVVPFSVIHDWQANVVGPLAIETAEKQNRDVAAHKALAEMQAKALAGEKFAADQWRPVLKAAFYDIYYHRYRAYAYAYADANANANADAYANAYAYAYAYAYADANADAYAYRERVTRLAVGMVECLKRVEA
jgi:hypothetical protein